MESLAELRELALTTPDGEVGRRAVQAIAAMDDPGVREALLEIRRGGFEQQGGQRTSDLARNTATQALADDESFYKEMLLQVQNGKPLARNEAVHIIGARVDEHSTKWLIWAAKQASLDPEKFSASTARVAIGYLAERTFHQAFQDAEALPALLALAKTGPLDSRRAAIRALHLSLDNQEVMDLTRELAEKDPSREVRMVANRSLTDGWSERED